MADKLFIDPDELKVARGKGYTDDQIVQFLSKRMGTDPNTISNLMSVNSVPPTPTLNPYVASAVTGLGKAGSDALYGLFEKPPLFGPYPDKLPDPKAFEENIGQKLGGWHQPGSRIEEGIEAGTRMTPAVIGAPETGALSILGKVGAPVAKGFAYGFAPGFASEMAGQAASGQKFPESLPFVGGQSAEPAVRAATAAMATPVARRAITQLPMTDRSLLGANKELSDAGIKQTASQYTGRNPEGVLAQLEGKNRSINPTQREGLTKAFSKMAGMETPELTIGKGGTLPAMTKVADQGLTDLAARNTLDVGTFDPAQRQQFFDSLRGINKQATPRIVDFLNKKGFKTNPVGMAAGDELRSTLFPATKTYPGQQYQDLHDTINYELERVAGEPGLRTYAQGLRDLNSSLGDAMETSIYHQNPNDLGGFKQARKTKENAAILHDARSKVGAGTQADPNRIEASGRSILGDKAWNEGQSQLQPLTSAAQKALPPLPSNKGWGTVASTGIGSLLGGLAGLKYGGWEPGIWGEMMGGAVGAAAGAVPGHIAGQALTTAPVQAILKNQIFPKFPEQDPQRKLTAMTRALIAGGQTPMDPQANTTGQ